MIDIALNSATNDIFIDGSGVLTTTKNLVQSVVIAFRLFLGEYDFDINIGVPWELAFSGQISQNDFIFELETQIVLIEGVEECTASLIKEGRTAVFNLEITVLEGDNFTISISEEGYSVNI